MVHVRRGSALSRLLPASAFEALERARRRIDEAEAEARRVRASAEEDAEVAKLLGREEGRVEGRAEAGALLVAAAAERDRLLEAAGPEVVALALEVARKVLGEEPRATPERVAALASRALRGARDVRAVVVRVSAADAPEVRALLPEGVEVVPDPTLGPGGCALDTPAGRIEAGLEAQLEEIAKALGGERAP